MAEGFEVPAGTVVMETAVDMQNLDRELRKVDQRGKEAGQRTGEAFGSGFGEAVSQNGARKATEDLGKRLDETGEKAEKAGKKVESADESILDLGESAETAGEGLLGVALILAEKVATGAARATTKMVGFVEIGIEKLSHATANAGRQLQDASQDMEHFGGVANTTGHIMEGVGETIGTVAEKLTALRIALAATIGAGFAKSIQEGDRMERTFNKIETVLPETTENVEGLRFALSEMAAQTRTSADTANNTFFKALTRMPRLAKDTETALEFVRTALEAHSTGFVDATDAVAAYEAVLQGFQKEAHEAEAVSDLLFKAQERAGVTFDKIAASVGDVASITNALNGEFEDLLAIYATLVPTGQSVSEVNTQIRGVVQGLINPSAEAAEMQRQMGLELSANRVRSEGLLTVMREIIKATEGNPEQIAKLFGRQEAVTLLVTLASRMEKLRTEQEQFVDASGEHAQTVEEMGDSIKATADEIGGDFMAMFRNIGQFFAPGVQRSLELVSLLTEGMRRLNTEFFRWIQGAHALEGQPDFLGFDLSAISLQQIEEIRELQFELGIIDEQRLRELEEEFGEAGAHAGEAFASEAEREAMAAMEGISAALREERRKRIREGRQLRQPPEIERPELPADPEFVEERARQIRRVGEVRAQMARMAGESEQEVQRILEENQERLNGFVETQVERLENYGFEAEELQGIVELWRQMGDEIENVEGVSAAVANIIRRQSDATIDRLEAQRSLLDMAKSVRDVLEEQRQAGAPPLPGGVERLDLGGSRARVRRALGPLEEALSQQGENAREVMEVLDEYGVSLEDLRDAGVDAFADMVEAEIRFEESAEDGKDASEEVANQLSRMASVTSGIVQAADAMGDLDDETRSALNSVTSLLQAGSQIAAGNFVSGGIQGFGALLNIGATLFGGGRDEIAREREQLQQSLRTLRNSAEEAAEALRGISGEEFDFLRSFLEEFERRLEARPDIESPVVAERMRERLAASGMSVDEFISKLEQSGQEFDDLEGALRGTGFSASGLEDELEAARAQLEELELSDLFEGFEGRMQELETRFQLFDIEEPIDQLEKIRQTFLEFAELPAPLEQLLGGADLSTAEGRRRFQEVLQQVFDMLASGELTPSQLGGLDPRQLQDLLTRMKSLTEEAADQEGSTSAFQVSRQVTEVTANRMIGTLTTISVLARQRNRYLEGIAGALGANIPDAIAPPPRSAVGGVGGGARNSFGPFNFHFETDEEGRLTQEDGRRAAEGFIDVLDQRIGGVTVEEERREGRV